jgi:hypothetical protein
MNNLCRELDKTTKNLLCDSREVGTLEFTAQIAIPIVPASVPVHRWQTAEAASSAASSASSKDCLENIRVVSVVMTKLKFSEIHWQIVSTDVVVRSDDAALQQSPERFNIVGVDFAANVFFSAMIDSFVALHVVRHASG